MKKVFLLLFVHKKKTSFLMLATKTREYQRIHLGLDEFADAAEDRAGPAPNCETVRTG
jgi:hypothetical protein